MSSWPCRMTTSFNYEHSGILILIFTTRPEVLDSNRVVNPLSWWDQFNQFNPAHFRTACVLRLSQSRYFTVTCMTTMRISVHVLNVPLSWHHRHPIQLYLMPNDDAWIIASAWLQTYKHSPYNVVLLTLVHYWKTNHTDLPFWAIISYARFLRGVECRPSLL